MVIERLKKAKTIEDYKKIGSVEEIVLGINKICNPLAVKCTTYEEIMQVMSVLKVKWTDFLSGPFINKQKELVFYLTVLDGEVRNKCLGVTDKHFEDKKVAQRWYKNLAKFVHPDKTQCGDNKAFLILQEMYQNMVDYEDGDSDE